MSALFSPTALVVPFEQLRMTDVEVVGGKNASLGEMISQLPQGVRVPTGFATTAHAFREFLKHEGLDTRINAKLDALDTEDVRALASVGAEIRTLVEAQPFPADLEKAIREAFATFSANNPQASFAVRSSATAEDLPDASFAGQQETFLNVVGIEEVLHKMKEVFASLYNDRAISYRVHQGFAHADVALSAGVQRMVRSDLGAAGVMFTIDTESGFEDVVFITSSYGLGETVVQGAVNPDEFYVHKPILKMGKRAVIRRNLGSKLIQMVFTSAEEKAAAGVHKGKLVKTVDVPTEQRNRYSLTDADVEQLAHYALVIEQHYGRPMDIEWGKDGADGLLYILQARPETVKSQNKGAELRTCHAAIIARELGIPAVVGCGDATETLKDGTLVTVSCAEGDTGFIYDGLLETEVTEVQRGAMPEIPVKITMNIGNPQLAFDFAQLPNSGVGLARLEFIINNNIGVHPKAILDYPNIDADLKKAVESVARGHASPRAFYVDKVAEGVATIGAAFWPKPVIVRLSDFKSNEYRKLIGGSRYEPEEENPMLGFRGAARYVSKEFGEAFAMECEAMVRVRNEMGLTNVELMVPFVRTLGQAKKVTELLAAQGLKRGVDGLKIVMMCEVPSNAILADQFLEYFDGFSIGSNDLTQLTLGLDRDSGLELLAADFDERDPAVQAMISMSIRACLKQGKYVGICGQGPSDHPDFARWLVEQGITSISLNPDSVAETWRQIAAM